MAQENAEKTSKIWRRKNITLVNETNDMKFRGKLSYRHFRILGWAFLFLAQLGTIFGIATTAKVGNFELAQTILSLFADLVAPLFLIAAFSQVLVAKNGYKKLILRYVAGMLGLFVLFLILYLHFIVGLVSAISGNPVQAQETVAELMGEMLRSGFLTFNVFVDLSLCTLLTFFLNYHPKEHFQGKKIYHFRAFAALPILYEAASIVLKMLASVDSITLSPFFFPLLTTKPPFAFLIFVAIAFFVKNRERSFLKKGKTLEDYAKFQETNVNRAHFASFLILCIFIAALLDFGAFIGISVIKFKEALPTAEEGTLDVLVTSVISLVYSWGFGKTLPMIFIVPLIIFYDYRKTYKKSMVDTIIPAAGVLLIVLLYVEGLFEIGRALLWRIMNEPAGDASDGGEASATLTGRLGDFAKNLITYLKH